MITQSFIKKTLLDYKVSRPKVKKILRIWLKMFFECRSWAQYYKTFSQLGHSSYSSEAPEEAAQILIILAPVFHDSSAKT